MTRRTPRVVQAASPTTSQARSHGSAAADTLAAATPLTRPRSLPRSAAPCIATSGDSGLHDVTCDPVPGGRQRRRRNALLGVAGQDPALQGTMASDALGAWRPPRASPRCSSWAWPARPTSPKGYPRFALDAEPTGDRRSLSRAARGSDYRTPYPQLEAPGAPRVLRGARASSPRRSAAGGSCSFYSSTVATDVVAGCLAQVGRARGAGQSGDRLHPGAAAAPRDRARRRSAERRLAGEPDPLGGPRRRRGGDDGQPEQPDRGAAQSPPRSAGSPTPAPTRGTVLVIDACFRAFDGRAQFDSYEVLDATGVEYVVIEDTGKLWPTGGNQARLRGRLDRAIELAASPRSRRTSC